MISITEITFLVQFEHFDAFMYFQRTIGSRIIKGFLLWKKGGVKMTESKQSNSNDNVFKLSEAAINSGRDIEEIKELLDEIRKLAPDDRNRWNFRYIIWVLGIAALSSPLVFGVIALTLALTMDNPVAPSIPAELIAISSTAVGALGAFLSSMRNS